MISDWMFVQQINKKELRKFGILVAVVLLLLSLWSWSKEGHPHVGVVVGLSFLAIAILFPAGLVLFYYPWMKLGKVLEYVNIRFMAGIVYYGLITPTALICRLMKKDGLRIKLDSDVQSYWLPSKGKLSSTSLRKQF